MRLITHPTNSVWRHTAPRRAFPAFRGEATVDVAIIGAGITGLTAALLLRQSGKRFIVLEGRDVASGVTGFSSAHLTTMLDNRYSVIESRFGEHGASLVAHSLQEAIETICSLTEQYNIDCDIARVSGYLYAESLQEEKLIEKELMAVQRAGLRCRFVNNQVPLPFTVLSGILFEDQARFHPAKYLHSLAQIVQSNNGETVFERSTVTDVKQQNDDTFLVTTSEGRVHAHSVVMATHAPFGFHPILQSKIAPYRSYVIGVRTHSPLPDCLFWDMEEPYHYICMMYEDGPEPLVIIGGEDHKTGEKRDTESCFANLEKYAFRHLGAKSVDYRWSAQLYEPTDGLPLIGKADGKSNLYIGTGYSGDGLTFGTVAGMLLADEILERPNPWARLYAPTRVKSFAMSGDTLMENFGIAAHWIGDRFRKGEADSFGDVASGEGKIMDVDYKKAAAYRDEQGEIHLMSPVCTHAKCIVGWNSVEGTWDCPCHGGRFTATGEVLNGPPMRDLARFER